MAEQRNIVFVGLIVAVVVLPSALSLAWYGISKDPNMRPLGITRQALRSYATGNSGFGRAEIVAEVEWVAPRTGGYTRAHLETAISDAFRAKGMDVSVTFKQGTDATRITYRVGKSVIGPFTTSSASVGVRAAIEAYRMYPPE